MWQLLRAPFWKFSKLSNNGITLNWSIIDEITTLNTTAYCTFLAHSYVHLCIPDIGEKMSSEVLI